MGYTVLVRHGRIRTRQTVFSSNISHNAMRQALDAACDLLEADARAIGEEPAIPVWTYCLVDTGLNGVTLDQHAIAEDRGPLVYAAEIMDSVGHPMTWVIKVLATAAQFASDHRGQLVLD
jgi:hypothetical protein